MQLVAQSIYEYYMQVQLIAIMNLGGGSIMTATLADKAKLSKTRRMHEGNSFKSG